MPLLLASKHISAHCSRTTQFLFSWPQSFPPGVFFSLSMWSAANYWWALRCHIWSKGFFLARQRLSTHVDAKHTWLWTLTPVFQQLFGWLLTILTSFLSAASESLCFPSWSRRWCHATLNLRTVVCTVDLWTCNCFEMARSVLFTSMMHFYRSVLSSTDFPPAMLQSKFNSNLFLHHQNCSFVPVDSFTWDP